MLPYFRSMEAFFNLSLPKSWADLSEENKKQAEKREDDLNRKYGFYIDHGCYMSITEKGSVYEWSNFTMLLTSSMRHPN